MTWALPQKPPRSANFEAGAGILRQPVSRRKGHGYTENNIAAVSSVDRCGPAKGTTSQQNTGQHIVKHLLWLSSHYSESLFR